MWEVFVVTMLCLLGLFALVGFILSLIAFRRVGRLELLVASLQTNVRQAPVLAPIVSPSVAPAPAPPPVVPLEKKSADSPPVTVTDPPPEDDRIPCPMCGGLIKTQAAKCFHCRAFLNPTADTGKQQVLQMPGKDDTPVPAVAATVVPPSDSPPASAPVKEKEAGNLESMVGERIMSGLGVLILVVGVSLLLWYSYTHLGTIGKVALAGSTGLVMIGLGAFLVNKARYLVPGGCLVAGGWAVTYATAYASHHVEAARVITSPTLGFFLVLGIGAGAIIHALQFRKEWVAGLAYGLLFLTFFIFRAQDTSLYALAPIALSFVLLVWRMRWIHLATGGLSVLYLLLFLSGGDNPLRSGISLGLLWAAMSMAQFLYEEKDDNSRLSNGIFGLLNMAGLVGCGVWLLDKGGVSQHWWIFAAAGLVYGLKSEISLRKASRVVYGVSISGAVLLVSWAAWRLIPDPWISLSWMGLALSTLLFGIGRKQVIPRVLGHLLLGAALFKTWSIDREMIDSFSLGGWEYSLRVIPALLGAFLFYGHAAISSRIRDLNKDEKLVAVHLLPWAGGIAFAGAISFFTPPLGVALVLSVGALGLVEAGRRFSQFHLRLQAYFFCLLAAGFFAVQNLPAEGTLLGISKRLLTTLPVLGLWFHVRRRLDLLEGWDSFSKISLSGLFLIGLLALVPSEIGHSATAFVWALLAGTWIVCGMVSRSGKTLLEGASISVLTVFQYALTSQHEILFFGSTHAAVVGIPVSVLFLAMHFWVRRGSGSWKEDKGMVMNLVRMGMTLSMAAALFMVLARSVEGTWLTGSWAILAVGLAFYGFLLRDRMCRWSSIVVLAVCLGKLFLSDFSSFAMPVKIATTIAVGGCMLAISIVYARNRDLLKDYFTAE